MDWDSWNSREVAVAMSSPNPTKTHKSAQSLQNTAFGGWKDNREGPRKHKHFIFGDQTTAIAVYGLLKACGGGKLPFVGRASGTHGAQPCCGQWDSWELMGSQMRGQNNMGDITVGVCYSSPEQDKPQEFIYSRRSLTLQAPGPHMEHELPSYLLGGKQKRE